MGIKLNFGWPLAGEVQVSTASATVSVELSKPLNGSTIHRTGAGVRRNGY